MAVNSQNKPPNSLPATTSPDLQALSALETWEVAHPLPAALTPERLSTLISRLQTQMQPASPQEYVRAMTKLIEFVTAFGISCGDAATVQKIYREKLGDLPGDLLQTAIDRITATWQWGNRMPFPAEIRATVSADIARRAGLLNRAKVASLKQPDSEEKTNVISAEKWAELRAMIRGGNRMNRADETAA